MGLNINPQTPSELLLWTALLGAYVPLLFTMAFEVAYSKARWAIEVALYLLCSAIYAFTLSGYFLTFAVPLGDGSVGWWWSRAPGVSACIVSIVGTLSVRNWLGTKRRDRSADVILLVAAWVCAICTVAVLILGTPASWIAGQAAIYIASLSMILTTAMAARAALLGDARAWEMASAGTLGLPLNLGLSAQALWAYVFPLGFWLVALAAFVVSLMIVQRAAWRRGRASVHVARLLDEQAGRDPITRLPMGAAMVKAMDEVYSGGLRLRYRPVLVAVRVFNADEIVKECGETGLNQVLLATLARIRSITAPADLIGRYYGACYIIQITSKVTPQYLRGLGLRLATSTRRPVVPRLPPSGFENDEPIETDVGVGICWCESVNDLTVAMHEAELAAEAARHMRSRAAVKLQLNEDAIAVEKALGQAMLKPSFLDSATRKLRRMPAQIFAATPQPEILGRAVRKVMSRSAKGPSRPQTAHKPSHRSQRRTRPPR